MTDKEATTVSSIEAPKAQYAQIADLIRARIDDGTYAPGSALPSEPALAAELGNVTRVTVNKAIGMLRAAGYVTVRRGAGTYVRAVPRITRDAQRRYSARDRGTGAGDVEVRELGLRPRTEYVGIDRVSPSDKIRQALRLGPDDDALVRRRRLFANDYPTQIADSYIPWSIAGGTVLEQAETGPGGSYSRLAEMGHAPVRFSEDITARTATDAESRLLELDTMAPNVIEIWHVAYTKDLRPVEVTVHVMPSYLWTLHYEWEDESGDE